MAEAFSSLGRDVRIAGQVGSGAWRLLRLSHSRLPAVPDQTTAGQELALWVRGLKDRGKALRSKFFQRPRAGVMSSRAESLCGYGCAARRLALQAGVAKNRKGLRRVFEGPIWRFIQQRATKNLPFTSGIAKGPAFCS